MPHTFGNYGALFMNAMTWWDHETESVWSQPWGRAIEGEHKGVELFLLASQVTTWKEWRESHPDTLVMINNQQNISPARRQVFSPNFVLGIRLGVHGKAYYYKDVLNFGIVNDSFAGAPIVVWATEGSLNAFVRIVDLMSSPSRSMKVRLEMNKPVLNGIWLWVWR